MVTCFQLTKLIDAVKHKMQSLTIQFFSFKVNCYW